MSDPHHVAHDEGAVIADDQPAPQADAGWDAITAAAEAHYQAGTERHIAYPPGVHFGAPLQGCSVYPAPDHWFSITYGLTECWEKCWPDPEKSGFGYEPTMRIARLDGEQSAPTWPFHSLATMADYARNAPQAL